MASGNYWTRIATHGIRRRRFVGGGLALTGAAAIAAACGSDDKRTTTQATQAPSGAPTQAAATTPAATPAAAAGTPVKGGVLRADIPNVFDSVDPHRALGDPTLWLSNQILSKLVRYTNPDTGEIEPDVSQKYEFPDASTYTFTLRQGVKWANVPPVNAREFVAEDVKWHIERQANNVLKDGSPGGMQRSAFYKTVTKIETPDKYTIKLTLNAPNGSFLDTLAAYFSTIPNREVTEQYEANHRTLNENAMVGTGPFMLMQWRNEQEIRLKRNPDHFRADQVLLDGWFAPLLFADPNAYRAAFLQKQVDGFGSPDPSLTKSIIEQNKGAMSEVLTGVANTVFLHLNRNKQFKDIRLVKAMNMAVDRRQLIQTFHQGLGQVSGAVPWLAEGYAIPPDDLIKLQGYRTDRQAEIREARQLWEAGGGKELGEIDIKIPDTWLANWPDTTQIIPKMFNDNLGVTQFKSTKTSYNEEIIPNLARGEFPNWFAWTSQVTSPDPRSTIRNNFRTGGSTNFNKVSDPQLDKLIDDMVQIVDLKQAVAKTREAQNLIMDNGQFGNIVLYNYISRSAIWNYYKANLKVRPQADKPGNGFNIYGGHLIAYRAWFDQKDPSWQGRPPASIN